MKVVMTIIGVILIILLSGTMLGGIDEAKTDDRTDTILVVTAANGGSPTTGTAVLVAELYDDAIANVVSITFNDAREVATPTLYTALTRTLTVGGLNDDASRSLTITYKVDALADYTAVGSFFGFLPLIVVIAAVVIVIAAMVGAFKNR